MKKIFIFLSSIAILSGVIQLTSCKKKNLFSKGNLNFSVDTLVFDTIFTTIGSTTQQFKLYNRENKTIKIEEVELMGGSASPFRINLDGISALSMSNIELEKKDSLFCFVEVTLNTNGGTLPLIIEDSIRFRTNGKDQYVRLAVWGQDMYYHYSNFKAEIFDTNEGVWPNDKPHVIYGAAIIDSAKTLNIVGGTDIYLHKNSTLFNYKGTLNIDGEKNNEVTFQGDRLESFYDDVAGAFYGIYFQEALPSTIDYAIIKNATTGIHVVNRSTSTTSPTVTISNTIIENAASYGMLLFQEPIIRAENVLIYKSGIHALIVLQGADMIFNHCDFLNYGSGDGLSAAIGLRNYYVDQSGTNFVGDFDNAQFNNCVIFSNSTEDQLIIDTEEFGSPVLNFAFRNCVIQKSNFEENYFTNCNASNPNFSNTSENDFGFNTSSSLNNSGNAAYTLLPADLNNNPRGGVPDIGVYEN
jgi:hypothetical protein